MVLNFLSQFKKCFFAALLTAGVSLLSASAAHAAVRNVLGNPDFEQELGGAIASGNWNSEPGRGVAVISTGAPSGKRFLELTPDGGGGGAFTFQTVTGAQEGDIVALSALTRVVNLGVGEEGQLRLEFQTRTGGFISAVNTSLTTISTTFTRSFVSSVAPAGTGQVTFVLRIQPANAGSGSQVDFDALEASFNGTPLFLEANPTSTTVTRGSARVIALRLHNLSADTLQGVQVTVEPPDGVTIRGESGTLDRKALTWRQGSIIFSVGSMIPGQESILSFPAILTAGALPGKSYDIVVSARAASGLATEKVHILFRAELDPVFDEGTIIGKVFNDLNQNGVQDGCSFVGTEENCSGKEKGIPWVRLATEEGVVVITDENGKYHIPAVKPGRHLVKIDGHTLPDGTKFITEEAYLVKTTPGLLNKANFAVLIPPSEIPKQYEQDMMVFVTQGLDTSRPDLEISMQPDIVRIGVKRFEKDPVFTFKMNYPEYIKNWFLEIRDEMGRPVWTGFGLGAPPVEVQWKGQMENGEFIHPGVYSYQLKVEDHKGYQDWTPLHFFRAVDKGKYTDTDRFTEIAPIGDFNIFKDGKRTIPLVAKPTIQVQGKTRKGNQVQINSYPVPVDPETGMFQTQVYTTPGDKEILVTTTNPQGESISVTKKIKVKDSTFFMVALGEEQLGENFQRGNIQSAGQDDLYKDGFYEDGRLSYYLRGKLKGKFLVKSHYDTGDKRSALFTNLDQDNYYPIYGDNSTRDYDALDTEDRFYLVVEMDRSFLKYGSFKTAFTDTELATYNRTLSGLKGSYESLATTAYGDPKRGAKLFWAEARHKADHNEFAATGGSLYYLRNRNIIQGSEKLRVEVRDRIQDISVESVDLVEGQDYEIDYPEGRILLTKPLSSVAASDTLVSQDILDGNPVYLIVDYEYDAGANAFEDTNRGIRAYTHMGNHFRVGVTGVEEKRQSGVDHEVRGVDLTMKVGRNTKVSAEYAETQQPQTGEGVSYNGGLSFANLEPLRSVNAQPRENAYLIKGESKPLQNLETSGYLQGVDPGFSTSNTRTQEGYRKYGLATRYKITDDFYLRYRYDAADLENELKPQTFVGVNTPYENLHTHTAQAVYDDHKWLVSAEYRKQFRDLPSENLSPTLLSEIPFEDGIAGKLGYHLNDRLMPYIKAQTGFNDKHNLQFGGGVRYQIMQNLYGYLEEMVGNIGDSTRFGFERYQGNQRSYVNLKMLDFGNGTKNFATTIGNSRSLSDKSRIYSERELSSFAGTDGYADILGYDKQINDHWSFDAKYERRHLDGSLVRALDQQAQNSLVRNNTFNTVSGALGYRNGRKLKTRTSLEVRRDTDTPELSQWVTRNNIEYQINDDLSYLGKLNYGTSRFLNPGDTVAAFTELSTGFAYRPLDNDRLNILTRYTLLRDIANDFQFANTLFNGVETDETDHIFSVDVAYDVFKYLSMVEKFAYKSSLLNSNAIEEVMLNQMLVAHRFNVHVTKKWDAALEYRALWQMNAAKNLKHGALTEVDREVYDYVRLGIGYNFTDFDDDLRRPNNYKSHGPFVRMTGKF